MKKISLIAISFLLVFRVAAAHGATSISGTLSDGSTITFSDSGSGLGIHPGLSSIQFLKSNINAGTPGSDLVLPAGWTVDVTGAYFNTPQYSSQSRGGVATQSILSWNHGDHDVGSGYHYDFGSYVSKFYGTFYVRVNIVSTTNQVNQWKMFRLGPSSNYTDTVGEILMTCQNDNASSCGMSAITAILCCSAVDHYTCKTDGSTSGPPYACYGNESSPEQPWYQDKTKYITTKLQWYQVDVFGTASTLSMLDGEFVVKIYDGTNTAVSYVNFSPTMTRSTAVGWRHAFFQNWLGNGLTEAYVWMTDNFIQQGSYARIELADSATYANIVHKEIQQPTSWAAGQVQFTLNHGSFASNASGLYIWVTTDSGTQYSYGPITLGTTLETLAVSNGGHGTVTSSPSGINCGTVCSASFDSGTAVTLTANPDGGYGVTWGGDCDSTGHVTMSAAKSCTAMFTQLPVQYLPWVAPQQ